MIDLVSFQINSCGENDNQVVQVENSTHIPIGVVFITFGWIINFMTFIQPEGVYLCLLSESDFLIFPRKFLNKERACASQFASTASHQRRTQLKIRHREMSSIAALASNNNNIDDTDIDKPHSSTMSDNNATANGSNRGTKRGSSYQIPRKPSTHKKADAPIRFNCRFGAVSFHRNHGKIHPKSPRGNQMTLSRRLSRRILKDSPGSPMWVISFWS